MRTFLLGLIATAGLLGMSPAADAAAPPYGSLNLGGVNLTYYCQVRHGQNYKSALLGTTAGDWRCVPVVHHYGTPILSISVQDACGLQYGKTGLIAYALNWNDPLSWRCFEPRPYAR